MPGFQDHFSAVAAEYSRFRPRYPESLFAWLAGLVPHTRLAWDCATGSGQAAVALAPHFDRVAATDASEEQIARAHAHPRVDYRRASAEASRLDAGSVALVTVAQALHWFDLERFHSEVRRVLAPGGVIAAWCYGLGTVAPEIDIELRWFYEERVGRYWPGERTHVERGYRDLPFPFDELPVPPFTMEASWPLRALLGYLGTWSAVQEARRHEGTDPMDDLARLRTAWGDPATLRTMRWPLALRVGREKGSGTFFPPWRKKGA